MTHPPLYRLWPAGYPAHLSLRRALPFRGGLDTEVTDGVAERRFGAQGLKAVFRHVRTTLVKPPVAPTVGEVNVRPANVADVPALMELLSLLPMDGPGRPVPVPQALEAFTAISQQQGRHLLVADLEDVLVGSVDMIVVPNLTFYAQPFVSVGNLVVSDSARRRGVGRALMKEVVRRARATGCYKIELMYRGRPEASLLYEDIGFHPTSGGYRLFPV